MRMRRTATAFVDRASIRMAKRKGRSREFIDDSDDPEDTGEKTKKSRVTAGSKSSTNEKGRPATASKTSASDEDEMIPLSAKRFVNVRMFNGRYLVDIREFYTDDAGERKPGRKGIALSLDQWEKLKAAVPEIDAKIHGN